MPTRKITNTGSRKNTGYFPSERIGRSVAFESLIELDYMYLLEFDREDVLSYEEQPVTIRYKLDGKSYRYTPDVLVIRKEKKQMIEVKPKKRLITLLADEKVRAKFGIINNIFLASGYEFLFVTDDAIRGGKLLENVKYLFMYSRVKVPSVDEINILATLNNWGQTKVNIIVEHMAQNGADERRFLAYIFSMLYSHQLCCDLTKQVNRESSIWTNPIVRRV